MSIVEAEGVITKEIKYGDSSRILTVITKEFGKISVLASGVRTNKSGLLAATQLFSHVSLTLFKGREKSLYKINSGELITSFSEIRTSLDKMAFASYLCEVANYIIQENAPDAEQTALLLNSLHLLASGKHSPIHIKAVYEFRTLALQGLLPDFDVCTKCGSRGDTVYFDLNGCCAYCADCGAEGMHGITRVGRSITGAVSYIAAAEPKKVFAFALAPESTEYLSKLGEYFTEHSLEKHFGTLDYLKKVMELENPKGTKN